jgi:hypothetical protein
MMQGNSCGYFASAFPKIYRKSQRAASPMTANARKVLIYSPTTFPRISFRHPAKLIKTTFLAYPASTYPDEKSGNVHGPGNF